MTLVLDAAPLVALADGRDPRRSDVRRVLEAERGDLVVPCPVIAEVDYLLSSRGAVNSALGFQEDLSRGTFSVACLERAEFAISAMLTRKYAHLNPGLADLSIVLIAARLGTTRILTFDQRHFCVITSLDGVPFTLLPGDE